jgi:hypothetical protein
MKPLHPLQCYQNRFQVDSMNFSDDKSSNFLSQVFSAILQTVPGAIYTYGTSKIGPLKNTRLRIKLGYITGNDERLVFQFEQSSARASTSKLFCVCAHGTAKMNKASRLHFGNNAERRVEFDLKSACTLTNHQSSLRTEFPQRNILRPYSKLWGKSVLLLLQLLFTSNKTSPHIPLLWIASEHDVSPLGTKIPNP